jgi:trimeric autotransporter adhesin
VRLHLTDYPHALADANQALALKPSYVKAYLAKSDAYACMDDLECARKALEQGLQVARNDELLTSALEKLLRRMRDQHHDLTAPGSGGSGSGSHHGSSQLRPPSSHRNCGSSSGAGTGGSSHGKSSRSKPTLKSGSSHSSSEASAAAGCRHGSGGGGGAAYLSPETRSMSSKSLSSTTSGTTSGSSAMSPSKLPQAACSAPISARRASSSSSSTRRGTASGKGSGGRLLSPPTKPRRTTTSSANRPSRPRNVSEFVQQTRIELKEQMRLVQAKLALIELLAQMDKDQKLDLLFGLIDSDRSGTVDAQELAVVLRSRNQLLSTGESISRAVTMVKAFDEDGNAELDRTEFELFFQSMVQHMNLDFDELAEYLSLELSFAKDNDTKDRNDAYEDEGIGNECDDFVEGEENESTCVSESESSASFHLATSRESQRLSAKSSGAATSAVSSSSRRQPPESSLQPDTGHSTASSLSSANPAASRRTSGAAAPTSSGRRTASGTHSSVSSSATRSPRRPSSSTKPSTPRQNAVLQ